MVPGLALSSTLDMDLACVYQIVEDVPTLHSTVDTILIGGFLQTFSCAAKDAEVAFVAAYGAMTTTATMDENVGSQHCLDEDNYCIEYCNIYM